MTANRLLLLLGSAALAAAAADRAMITGRVTGASGNPLEHATVLVYQAGVKLGYSTFCPSCYADCGKRAVTDSRGSFMIENLSPDLKFELLVVRDGYISAFVKSVDPAMGPARTAVLRPRQAVGDAARMVRGKVVDSGGLPMRDAIVKAQGILYEDPERGGHDSMYGEVASLDPIAVTNEQGDFEISYDRAALETLIIVEARGMAPKLFNHLSTGNDRHTLTVTEGATVRGRLVENGKPVADAEVGLIARQRGMGAELTLIGSPYEEIRIGTEADGTFVITNVPAPVDWYVYGKMESLVGRGGTVPVESATKADGEDVEVGDIQVQLGYRLRGKVVLSDGKAIGPGMSVMLSSVKAFDSRQTALAADGSFEFAGLAPGKYEVGASVRGYREPEWDFKTQPERPGTVQVDHAVDGLVLMMYPRSSQ
jgi:protocatechuate 3,4-dioxygenase beta subunit